MRPFRFLKYQYYRILRLRDAPARIARGVGLGLAMDFAVPIPLMSIFVALVAARLLKFNGGAAVISAMALKPFFPGIITLNLYVSSVIGSLFPVLGKLSIAPINGTTLLAKSLNGLLSKGIPYLIACQVNAVIIFFISSVTVLYLLQSRVNRLRRVRK